MKYRVLGRTGLRVSEVGFGAWAIGGNAHGNSYGPTDDETSRRAILRAVELGCNFFDTADVYGYGHSEELLGQTVGKRPDVLIATKVGGNFYSGVTVTDFNPRYIVFACEQSLKRLRREAIDLYQLHNPPMQMVRGGRIFDVLEELKRKGKICHYGVSIFTPEEGLACVADGRPETLQLVYNIVNQTMARRALPAARAENVGVIVREPLANGFLTGKYDADAAFVPGDIRYDFPPRYKQALAKAAEHLQAALATEGRTLPQAALRFILDHDVVSVVIPGCKTPAQVEENVRASELVPLRSDELESIYSFFR
ncbi:MAG: aldo/keto reductase [Chloroflexi bacterium]|nr:aldo/keto reductase [Chloroflexota bacterium]